MDTSKIKQFVTDHKAELILIGASAVMVISGIALVSLGVKTHTKKSGSSLNGTFKARDIPVPEALKGWDPTDLWVEGPYLNGIFAKIPVDDLGRLGEEYIKNGLAKSGDVAGIVISTNYE